MSSFKEFHEDDLDGSPLYKARILASTVSADGHPWAAFSLTHTPEELQDEARTLLEERGRKAKAARKLDVTRGTITNALNTDTPSRYLQTLIGIIAAMSDYTIEAETVTVCRVVKKAG